MKVQPFGYDIGYDIGFGMAYDIEYDIEYDIGNHNEYDIGYDRCQPTASAYYRYVQQFKQDLFPLVSCRGSRSLPIFSQHHGL